jgi:hypothetical protein
MRNDKVVLDHPEKNCQPNSFKIIVNLMSQLFFLAVIFFDIWVPWEGSDFRRILVTNHSGTEPGLCQERLDKRRHFGRVTFLAAKTIGVNMQFDWR